MPGASAHLSIAREFLPEHSLIGLSRFSHVWLISFFHLNTNKKFLPKVHPPRLQGDTVGLFASRSPHRPSPIGLSLARLVKISGNTIHLAGIDLVDGTPILDVKPYIPEWDIARHATSGWTADARFPSLKAAFSERALQDIRAAEKRLSLTGVRALLADILAQDLRNPRDRSQNKEGLELGFFLHDFEVRFAVRRGRALVRCLLTGTVMHKKDRRAPPKRVDLTGGP